MSATTGTVILDPREEADRHKPTFADLRAEGMSIDAIVALYTGRDALHAGDGPVAIAELLGFVQQRNPFDVAEVRPGRTPTHWLDNELYAVWAQGQFVGTDEDVIDAEILDEEYDPTDAELAAAWAAPGAPHAHQVAWTLHQELHDRSAS